MKQLIQSKENESATFKDQIAYLEKKNEELRQYIHGAKMDPDDPMSADKAAKAR